MSRRDSELKTRRDLFAEAYDRDYTTTSVLNVFDVDMASAYGWTVLDSEWEMYGQSKDGAVDVLDDARRLRLLGRGRGPGEARLRRAGRRTGCGWPTTRRSRPWRLA